MASPIHELVWVAVLLDGCPNVAVLTVRIETESLSVADDWVPMIVVDVHADSHADAERLSVALRLAEVGGRVTESHVCGALVWRAWEGWAADGSRDAAVWVSVTGADPMAVTAVA